MASQGDLDAGEVGVHHKNRKLHEKIGPLKMDRYGIVPW